MAPVVVILAAIGVVAAAVTVISKQAEEQERHRRNVAKLKRKAVSRRARRDRARLQADVEHRKWVKARDHLRKIISAARKERQVIFDELFLLKDEGKKIRDHLNDAKGVESRFGKRAIREALYEYYEAIDRKYADAYRYTAFIDRARRLRDDLYGSSPNPTARIKAARQFDMESMFESGDVPVRGQVVTGIVRAPKSGPWFQLDCSIRGHLEKRERDRLDRNWSKGERIRLFVEVANYRDGTAVVSIKKARFLEEWEGGKIIWTGKVKERSKSGVSIDLDGVIAFVPRSEIPANWGETTRATVELIEVDQRLRTVIGRLVASA